MMLRQPRPCPSPAPGTRRTRTTARRCTPNCLGDLVVPGAAAGRTAELQALSQRSAAYASRPGRSWRRFCRHSRWKASEGDGAGGSTALPGAHLRRPAPLAGREPLAGDPELLASVDAERWHEGIRQLALADRQSACSSDQNSSPATSWRSWFKCPKTLRVISNRACAN